jgi:diguanylate cyclase (GGDEF)-like protein
MDPNTVLSSIRPMIVVLDATGTIRAAYGGNGGALGYQIAELVGRNALEFVVPSQQERIATFFLESGDASLSTVSFPIPFRAHMVTASGEVTLVDVIPTGLSNDPDVEGWVVVLIPHSMLTSPYAPLEAIVAGRPIAEVFALICKALDADHPDGRRLRAYVLADDPSGSGTGVHGAVCDMDDPLLAQVAEAVSRSTNRWDDRRLREMQTLTLDQLGGSIARAAEALGFTGARLIPVFVGGDVAATIMCFDNLAHTPLFENMRQRFQHVAGVVEIALSHHRSLEQLKRAAMYDSLTGLANRDEFHARTQAATDPYSVLYIDIDHFKVVNDTYGHRIGDAVLVEVARRIEHVCRAHDLVARLSGDEFAVMINDVDPEAAAEIGRRVIDTVAQPLRDGIGPVAVTVSVGLARHQPREPAETVIDRADRAMLTAKRTGRSRLITAP